MKGEGLSLQSSKVSKTPSHNSVYCMVYDFSGYYHQQKKLKNKCSGELLVLSPDILTVKVVYRGRIALKKQCKLTISYILKQSKHQDDIQEGETITETLQRNIFRPKLCFPVFLALYYSCYLAIML